SSLLLPALGACHVVHPPLGLRDAVPVSYLLKGGCRPLVDPSSLLIPALGTCHRGQAPLGAGLTEPVSDSLVGGGGVVVEGLGCCIPPGAVEQVSKIGGESGVGGVVSGEGEGGDVGVFVGEPGQVVLGGVAVDPSLVVLQEPGAVGVAFVGVLVGELDSIVEDDIVRGVGVQVTPGLDKRLRIRPGTA